MTECRTLIDRPRSGSWNMAIDEVLLVRASREKCPQFRLYAWDAATLSLGYFQRAAERISHRQSMGCPLVRRPSGGGAIVHDQEVTYSLAIPGEFRGDAAGVYRRAHGAFVTMLQSLGVRASIVGAVSPQKKMPPLLCFHRLAAGDVVVEGQKVVGSAQRRGRGALLQHGSILLRASPAAPELPGILNLLPIEISYQMFVQHARQALIAAFDWSSKELPLSTAENDQAETLVATKYGCRTWNYQR